MDLFAQLKATAIQQSRSGELPSWLLAEILEIASEPVRYREQAPLVETLIELIKDYDPYAGTGCFGSNVGIGTLQAALRNIRSG
jgi:hypothetical protein